MQPMQEYWKKNQRLIAVLLVIWAVVSYGFAIFGARLLYRIPMFSVPMSFWWAQQGSMFVFVILIFVYARRMDKLDREYGVGEDE
jgi:putative solute:sodium symporter small subunit